MADNILIKQIQEIRSRLIVLVRKQKQRIESLKNRLLEEQQLRADFQSSSSRMGMAGPSNSTLHVEIDSLKKRLQEEMNKNAELVRSKDFQSDRTAMEAEIRALRQQLSDEIVKTTKMDTGQYQSERTALEAEVRALKKQLSEEIEKVAKLSTASTDISSIRITSEAEIRALKAQLEEEISRGAKVKAESDNALAEMKRKMKEMEESTAKMRMKMERFQDETSKTKEQMEIYQRENQKLQQFQKRDEANIYNLKKEIQKQENLLKERAAEVKVLNKKIQELNDEIEQVSQSSHAFHMIRLEKSIDELNKKVIEYVEQSEQHLLQKGIQELYGVKNQVYDYNKINEQVFSNLFHKINELEFKLKNHLVREKQS